jgi:hypothetical protein
MNQKLYTTTQERYDFFCKHYNLIWYKLYGTKKKYLGNAKLKQCRFCGATETTTTFRKIAHALPQLIGNNTLISLYECDSCNERFDKTLDNHLGNYLGLERTLSGIKGKKGIPKFKSQRTKIVVKQSEVSENQPDDGNEILIDDPVYKYQEVNESRPSYVPRLVYKSFVKMALSVMPRDEIIHFKKAIEWIIENPEDDLLETDCLVCKFSFVPGLDPFKDITAVLGIRKNQVSIVPHSFFFIAFSNYTFQIFVPFSDMDKHLEWRTVSMVRFPSPYDETSPYGPVQKYRLNWSSNEPERSEPIFMTMAYESSSVEDLL